MSEEEKKTFNFLKTFVKTEIDYCKLEKADVLDILNLIEKQQKEIEELKKDKKALVDNYSKVLETFISKDKIKEKIKDRKHIIHNAKLKYGQDYKMYEDTINAKNEIELYKELLEE